MCTRSIAQALILVLIPGLVFSQDYPIKPVRIVTTAAGGGNDFNARLIAQGMSGLGQPLIVDNRATGLVVADAVMQSPPDGYTLMVAGGSFLTAPLIQKTSYEVIRDFVPITLIAREIN